MGSEILNSKSCTEKGYVLWLPSWYPNKFEPVNGDFTQRHAQATASYSRVTICHFPQLGPTFKIENIPSEDKATGNLREIIFYIRFHPWGIKILDTIRYNIKYYKTACSYLKAYFKKNGLPSLVHVHVPVKAGNIALWIKKKYGINYIVSEHSALYLEGAEDSFSKRSVAYRSQVRNVFQKAIKVTNVSDALGKLLQEKFQLKNISTVYNVVDTDLFHYTERNNSVFTFIHVSSLNHQKNITGILNVFGRLKNYRTDWKLQIIGPTNETVHSLVRNLGLETNVESVGEVSYPQVAEYMRQANVLVLFSRYENFPCVVIEALCCGLPVVASDVGGIKEAVNSTNGILVESENEEQLSKALLEVQEKYHLFDTKMIAQDASALYNYKEIGSQFFNLYCSVYRK